MKPVFRSKKTLGRRLFLFLCIIVIAYVSFIFFLKPLITFLAVRQLSFVCKGAEVSIGKSFLTIHKQLSFSDIKIKKDPFYDISLKELTFNYTPLKLMQRTISSLQLRDLMVVCNAPQKSLSEIKSFFRVGGTRIFILDDFEVSNATLSMKTKDLSAFVNVSIRVNLKEPEIKYLDVHITSLDSKGLMLENALLKVDPMQNSRVFYIRKLQYDKMKVMEVKSDVTLKEKDLFLNSLSAQMFNGQIEANLSLHSDKNLQYLINLKFSDVDLATLIKEFNLSDKVELTGKIGGTLLLQGSGFDLKVVSGDFSTGAEGGLLVITDNKFLENIARTSQQPLDTLVESFKNYRYNSGIMNLSLKDANLMLDIDFDGSSGKRSLDVTLHDLIPKEGK